MTTYECPSCFEAKEFDKHSICGNGHLAGCQKCQMKFIQNKYTETLWPFRDKGVMKCMVCREDLDDIRMGRDWQKHVDLLQPMLVAKALKDIMGLSDDRVEEIIENSGIMTKDALSDYDIGPLHDSVWAMVAILGKDNKNTDSILMCRYFNYLVESADMDINKIMLEVKKIYTEYFWGKAKEDEDDKGPEVEVEAFEYEGKEYYYGVDDGKYYDPITDDEIDFEKMTGWSYIWEKSELIELAD